MEADHSGVDLHVAAGAAAMLPRHVGPADAKQRDVATVAVYRNPTLG